jgi:hypothetical protein
MKLLFQKGYNPKKIENKHWSFLWVEPLNIEKQLK